MATEKQIAANQRNAKLSHGPTTEAGLLASQINNFRHGLAVKTHENFGLLYDENPEKFDELLNSLRQEHNPTTETEGLLVRRMAEYEWLRARALRFQADCLMLGEKSLDTAKLALFIRYQTTHERAFYKALNELQSLREQKRNTEIGIESQQLKQSACVRAAEALNLKKDAFNLKKEEFEFKKETLQTKKAALAAQPVPETGSGGLQKAA